MFRALLRSSSGESVVLIHLVYVTLYRWPSGVHTCTPDGHLYRVTYTRYREVCGSVRRSTVHREKSNKIQQFINIFIISFLYEAQHVLSDTSPIIRSLKLHWQPLVLHTWKVVGCVVVGRCQAHCAWKRPTTTRPTSLHVWKTRGCQYGFRLLMMGGVSPETWWASYKYGIIKMLIHCCILLEFFLRIDQISYWYNWFSWWWAQGCSKHVENWNKHIRKKELCFKLVIYKNRTEIHALSTEHKILPTPVTI
jgi:hypothetical protein